MTIGRSVREVFSENPRECITPPPPVPARVKHFSPSGPPNRLGKVTPMGTHLFVGKPPLVCMYTVGTCLRYGGPPLYTKGHALYTTGHSLRKEGPCAHSRICSLHGRASSSHGKGSSIARQGLFTNSSVHTVQLARLGPPRHTTGSPLRTEGAPLCTYKLFGA